MEKKEEMSIHGVFMCVMGQPKKPDSPRGSVTRVCLLELPSGIFYEGLVPSKKIDGSILKLREIVTFDLSDCKQIPFDDLPKIFKSENYTRLKPVDLSLLD